MAALDLGSGTIKLSVFQRQGGRWAALWLEEANTELRRGMGPERTLKPGPIADTLAAVRGFQAKARELGVERLPAYATSAVRKAGNPQDLLAPLSAMGVETKVLGEEDEGRLNLLGATARNLSSPPVKPSSIGLSGTPLPSPQRRGEGVLICGAW